ncbi:uncharacterized protein PADG_02956 [Paracoccidioides brasiliensis Pb18]|uniref:Mid2 domain-containing protein n=1 Tax=Paracoccidioides brasiliensis (strain Pb18) TaxID=502780 RepID=C1G701_PARBD|nr:uncharacterized protein PADG_02956 [Paracoccidioides brasiliensis Pb18]EEH46858.2 hypothetical protein PADG_02956 [Paracoccidioides brasiliensis Pb18]
MQRLRISSGALAILTILSQAPLTQSFPFPVHFNLNLASRDCTPCGFYSQECCTALQTCSTNANNQAVCVNSPPAKAQDSGQWETFTTTYVRTDLVTVTSTGSRLITAPTSGNQVQCQLNLGESLCGTICCTAAQACNTDALRCVESGSSPFEPTVGPAPTPPTRPTSSGRATITAHPTAAVPFIPPVGSDGQPLPPQASTGGRLSGGAIAGIVIGVLVGVVLLFLICLSACAKGAITTILALLGLGKKRGSSSGSGSTQSFSDVDNRPPGRTWFGYRPSRPPAGSASYSSYSKKSKKSGLFGMGKWTSVGLILGALAICLGLRSKKKQNGPPSSASYSDSYYYYDYSSSSSSSSAPRTKRSQYSKTKSKSRSRSRSTKH